MHRLKPDAPVIVRTVDDNDIDRLRDAGASEVVPEVMEGALMLGTQTMLMVGVPLARVLKRIRQTREARYGTMRGYFRGLTDDEESEGGERLISLPLSAHHGAVGRPLSELRLEELRVTLVSLRRPGSGRIEHDAATLMQAGDILLLRGTAEALAAAELKLGT